MATTELHKVPATILSRCQRFAFRRLSQEDIAARLQYVAYQENIDLDDSAAKVLARLADGGMRDGLSLLDQCASATAGELTAEKVYACLGIAGEQKCGEMMSYVASQNTRGALELFNRLYADGKDLGALLDELACLARDLLVLKTAPDSAVSMLTGIVQDQQAASLADAFSSGELVRIIEQLERTMQGFTRSASRRVDAELCIISLCQPELQLDPKSLNARLTKLEEQVKNGKFVSVAPQIVEQLPDEEPPAHTAQDTPPEEIPEPEIVTEDTPIGFWTELVAAVRQELGPPISGFFATTPSAPVQGVLRDGKVVLKCTNSFTLEMVNKPEILSLVGRKASAILNRPVSAAAEDVSASGRNNPRMEQLMDFGRTHSNVINIKDR